MWWHCPKDGDIYRRTDLSHTSISATLTAPGVGVVSFLLFRRSTEGSERLSDPPKIAQLVLGELETGTCPLTLIPGLLPT